MTWRRLLEYQPKFGGAALTHAELEACVVEVEGRYRDRMLGLEALRRVQVDLEIELDGVLASDERQEGWFDELRSVLSFLGPRRPAPLRADVLQQRHQAALARLRALGHHLDALERDVVLVDEEITRLSDQVVCAARDRELALACASDLEGGLEQARAELAGKTGVAARELESSIHRLDALLWTRQQEARRYAVIEERLAELVTAHHALRELLHGVHGSLSGLHDAGRDTVAAMGRQVVVLAADANERDLRDLTDLDALRASVQRVAHLAHDSAAYLSEQTQELELALQRLDDQARLRRQAEAEVDRLVAAMRSER